MSLIVEMAELHGARVLRLPGRSLKVHPDAFGSLAHFALSAAILR